MTCGVTVVMNRGGGLQMFLEPLSKCSRCFSNVLLITFQPVTFEPVNYATLFVMWSLSFGATNSSFRVFPLLKCTCMPYLLQMFLKLSLRPLLYGTVMTLLLMVLVLVPLLLFFAVLGILFFNFILLMAHAGYLQACNTLCMCVYSSSS